MPAIRGMKRGIDRELARRGAGDGRTSNVKLGRGGIREIEFIVQALQLLYGGDDAWLRERNSLKALFRLTERGYLAPELGRTLSHALVHLRTVEHRLQLLHELQTHTLPSEPVALGLWRGASASAARRRPPRGRFARAIGRSPARCIARSRPSSPSGRRPGVTGRRLPSLVALGATGFADPEHARQNLRLILEGRPLVPYAGALAGRAGAPLSHAARRALEESRSGRGAEPVRALPVGGGAARRLRRAAGRQCRVLLEGLVRLCAGGDLLTQLLIAQPELLASLADPSALGRKRTRATVRAALARVWAPEAGPAERRDRLRQIKQAEELTIVWRYLLGVTSIERYAREMTLLAEATLEAGWLMALGAEIERHGVPRAGDGRFVPAVIVGVGKLGGRELTTGSDLDLFVVFDDPGPGRGRPTAPIAVDVHTFYSDAVERLAGALGDITAGRHRVRGRPSSAAGQQGQWLRGVGRRAGTVL